MSCGPIDRSYRRFLGQDQLYYEKLTQECDVLLSRGPTAGIKGAEKLAEDRDSLPPKIRELHPVAIILDTNAVSIRVGYGFGAYSITWVCAADHSWGRLTAYREGDNRIVYIKSNP